MDEGFEISKVEGSGLAFFRFEQRPLVLDVYATVSVGFTSSARNCSPT